MKDEQDTVCPISGWCVVSSHIHQVYYQRFQTIAFVGEDTGRPATSAKGIPSELRKLVSYSFTGGWFVALYVRSGWKIIPSSWKQMETHPNSWPSLTYVSRFVFQMDDPWPSLAWVTCRAPAQTCFWYRLMQYTIWLIRKNKQHGLDIVGITMSNKARISSVWFSVVQQTFEINIWDPPCWNKEAGKAAGMTCAQSSVSSVELRLKDASGRMFLDICWKTSDPMNQVPCNIIETYKTSMPRHFQRMWNLRRFWLIICFPISPWNVNILEAIFLAPISILEKR